MASLLADGIKTAAPTALPGHNAPTLLERRLGIQVPLLRCFVIVSRDRCRRSHPKAPHESSGHIEPEQQRSGRSERDSLRAGSRASSDGRKHRSKCRIKGGTTTTKAG
jgi:hypothetical protein